MTIRSAITSLMLVSLFVVPTAHAQIQSLTKISDTQGGFTGTIGPSGQFGRSVAAAGDVDGDMVPDIIVGEPFAETAWLLFMNADGTVKGHTELPPPSGSGRYGESVAGLGDIDGDSIPDVAVGIPLGDDGGSNRGIVWIFRLNSDGTIKASQKISSTSGGFIGTLDDGDEFGSALAGIGDADGDTIPDIAIGAPGDDDGSANTGAMWILYMQTDGTVKNQAHKISDTAGGFTGDIAGTRFGSSIALLDDLDGNGAKEIAVGATLMGGAVWVLFMNTGETVDSHRQISDGVSGFNGTTNDLGRALAWLGDVDGDGHGELAVSASYTASYLGNTGLAWYLSLDNLGIVKDQREITLIFDDLNDGDALGRGLAVPGDLDGDGSVDLVLGLPGDDDGNGPNGSLYVAFNGGCRMSPDQLIYLPPGQPSTPVEKDIVLYNDSGSPVAVNPQLSCTGFSITAGGGPGMIAAAGSLVVTVEFNAPVEGEYSCVLDTGCRLVGMYADAREPEILVSPTSISKNVVGGTSLQQSLYIYNSAAGPLTWNIENSELSEWLTVSDTAGTLYGPGNDVVTVTMTADTMGQGVLTDTINVYSNDLNENVTPVIVTMTILRSQIDISPLSFVFPDVFVGGYYSMQLTITNTGTTTLVGGISAPTGFTVDPVINIPVGQFDTRTVSFVPPAAGSLVDSLYIITNSITPDVYVPVSGTGIDPADIYANPDTISATIPPGTSVGRTVTVHNDGPVNSSFSLRVGYSEPSPAPPLERRVAVKPSSELADWETTERDGRPSKASGVILDSLGTLPFEENFEDGDYNGWVEDVAATTREVTSATAANGTNYSYHESGGSVGHSSGIHYDLGIVTPASVSFWVQPGQDDDFSTYFTLRDSQLREAIFFFALTSGYFYCNANVGGNSTFPYIAGTWYHIEFRNIDYSAKTFDYFVDGFEIQTDISFRNAADVNHFARIELYNYSAGAEAWWDEIQLLPNTPVSWLQPSAYDGIVSAYSTLDVPVTIDADTLPSGTYSANIQVILSGSNYYSIDDQVEAQLVVDSTLTDADDPGAVPERYALRQNAPNPFNPVTTIAFDLRRSGPTRLEVFDVRGRRVRTLLSGNMPAGHHSVTFAGTGDRGEALATGVYFYRLASGPFTETRKMVLLK